MVNVTERHSLSSNQKPRIDASECRGPLEKPTRVPTLLDERVFQSDFRIFPGAFGHSLQLKYIKYETFITDVHHSFLCNTN